MSIFVNPSDDMNINEALNAAIDVAAHVNTPVCMKFGGMEFIINIPKGQIPVKVFGVHSLRQITDEALIDEYVRRAEYVRRNDSSQDLRDILGDISN